MFEFIRLPNYDFERKAMRKELLGSDSDYTSDSDYENASHEEDDYSDYGNT